MAAVMHLIVELRSDHRRVIALALELKQALDARTRGKAIHIVEEASVRQRTDFPVGLCPTVGHRMEHRESTRRDGAHWLPGPSLRATT